MGEEADGQDSEKLRRGKDPPLSLADRANSWTGRSVKEAFAKEIALTGAARINAVNKIEFG